MKRNHLAWIVACLSTTAVASAAYAQSPDIAFVTTANSLDGSLVHYDTSGDVVDEATIRPQMEATTDTDGSDAENASTNSGVALGIDVYAITNSQNSTSGCNNLSGCDQTSAGANVSTISLLGGLINIDVQSTTLTGVADTSKPNQVDITAASVSAAAIGGSGISIPSGTYSGGTSFPVSGAIQVPVLDAQGNPTGDKQSETFTGHLIVAQILQGSDPTTGASVLSFAAEQLIGKVSDGQGGYYQITLGGPQTPPSPGSGSGPSYSINVAPTFHVTG